MDTDDYEWELSKENVRPLRQGRQMSSLAVALHSASTSSEQEDLIKENQRAFEEELRAYAGDDPFDVWDRYIKWTEQYFPKGGLEGHLSKLIERCLQKFQTDPSYINDVRFIRLWIKFASLSEKPAEVYSYMFDKGIGHKVAAFYVEWALTLEMDGDTKRADTIYTEGLNRLAEPRELLQQKQQQFVFRLARSIVLQKGDCGETEMEVGETEEERTALGRLKVSGAHHKVGTTRTGGMKQGSAGFFKNAKTPAAKQLPTKGISIFVDNDENDPNCVRPQVTHEWKSMPRKIVDNCENDKKPGKWTDARARQRPSNGPSTGPTYQIHEDTESAQETPQKTAFVTKQPLSSRKGDRPVDVLSGIRDNFVVCPGEGFPQYQKDKVYNGVTEFSFEELRAIKYWKQKKERGILEERLRVDAERKQREEAMAAQLREQGERIAMMESLLQSQLRGLNIQPVQNGHQQPPLLEHNEQQMLEQTSFQEQPSQSYEKPVSQRVSKAKPSQGLMYSMHGPASSQKEDSLPRAGTSARQELFNQKNAAETTLLISDIKTPTNETELCPSSIGSSGGSQRTPIFNSLSSYLGKTSVSSGSSNSSVLKLSKNKHAASAPSSKMNESCALLHNNSSLIGEPGKNSFSHYTTPGSNESSISHKPLQSPTVCTKEALQLVQGMFCTDLEQDNLVESIHEYEKPVAFKICEDAPPEQKLEQKPGGFQIHCDEQSEAPASVRKEEVRSFGVRKSFLPVDGNCDFTIECQARDDMTIAPLGNFSMQGRAASTPFSASHIKSFEPTHELRSEVSLHSCSTSVEACDRGGATVTNNLSPITENSEGSNEETHSTKSHSQVSELSIISKAKTTLPPGFSIKEEDEQAEDEGDISMHDDQPLDATHQHLIDTSACVEQTHDLLSASASTAPRNPFDEKYNAEFLSRLNPPLSSYPNYHNVPVELPQLSIYALIQLGNEDDPTSEYISVEKCLGEGGYAKVFLVSRCSLEVEEEDSEFLAMKVQRPPCYWEFYIAREMQTRLTALNAPIDMTPSLAHVKQGYFYNDCSLLMMDYMEHGTLLNLINVYKGDRQLMAGVEPFACLLTIELLRLIEQLHKCNFIHGDVKPDNFLFRNLPRLADSQNSQEVFGSHLRLVCLTDFGQSIDLTMFPPGTTFRAEVATSAFQCIEMRTDRPWTFQTDLFGLAGTIHVALFGSYMKVFMERGSWKITSNFVRKWNVPLWKKLFQELLNIPSCDLMPNLSALRQEFEDYMMSSLIKPYNSWVQAISGKLTKEAALENTVT